MSNGIKKLLSAALACGAFGGSLTAYSGNVCAMDAPAGTADANAQEVVATKISPLGGNWSNVGEPKTKKEQISAQKSSYRRDLSLAVSRAINKLRGRKIEVGPASSYEMKEALKNFNKNMSELFPTTNGKAFALALKSTMFGSYAMEVRGINGEAIHRIFRDDHFQGIEDPDAVESFNNNLPDLLVSFSNLFRILEIKNESETINGSSLVFKMEDFITNCEMADKLMSALPNRTEKVVRDLAKTTFWSDTGSTAFDQLLEKSGLKLGPKSEKYYNEWVEGFEKKSASRDKGLEKVLREKENPIKDKGGKKREK